jgi:DNA polymerase elongation subunit (family B)
LLRAFTDFRLRAKAQLREAGDPLERSHLGALQQAFKILINAFYGYLAFGRGHWNDFAAADRVTAEGRRIVSIMLERLTELGAEPIEVDTDGVYFVPPAEGGPGAEERLLAQMARAMPSGINLELAGRYAAMFSYKMKTYALLDERGRLTLKGSALRSRGLEPFLREIIEAIVRLLIAGRPGEVRAVIDRWMSDFGAHRVPVRQFARTETLQDPLEIYRARVRAGARNPSAAYEVAFASGRALLPGDQVTYYIAGRSQRASVAAGAKLARLWNPAQPDEDVEYYQGKVLEVWARFRPFTEFTGLRPYSDGLPPQAQLDFFR